ncbi:hypothetical protein EBZ39_07905 [bacterium]|nr:hypothetical protein [bacterium]
MNGFFTSACKPVSDVQSYQSSLEKKNDEVEGVNAGLSSDARGHAGLCVVLEQHRYWEIDEKKVGSKDGKKLIVPVVVWVDMESRSVKRMTIRYKTNERGQPLDNRNPVEYFTHYKFFENPDGFYGYGYGHMLAQINSGVNAALRSSLDAATLANEGNMAGFMSQRMNPQDDAGSEIRLQMGKFITVPDTVANIKDGIMQMSFPGPNPALAEIMQYLDQRGQRLGSVTEASTGQIDKIRQSNALMTELEQALELPSNIHMRIVDSLTEELGKVYELNRYYMSNMEVFVINDKPEIVTRDDYSIEAAVAPVFDPRMSTMAQKIARAQTELDAVMRNPVTANDPNVMLNAQRRFFEAIETDEIEELLPQPPQPVEPMRIDDQRAENAVFLSPKGATIEIGVFADQDHVQHLAIIDEFANSQFVQELSPEAAQKLAKHRQEHIAYLYEQESGLAGQGQQAPAEIGVGGMGQPEGGQVGPQAIAEQIPEASAMGAVADMGASASGGGGAEGVGGLGEVVDGGGAVA